MNTYCIGNLIIHIMALFSVIALGEEEKKSVSANENIRPDIRRICWKHWEGNHENSEVFFDGVFAGKGRTATAKLASLTVAKGSIVKLAFLSAGDSSAKNAGDYRQIIASYFEVEGFLRKWIWQGTCVTFEMYGHQKEIHTLAAFDEKGRAVDPEYSEATDGTFIFDGTTYESVADTVSAMSRVAWEKESILVICKPDVKIAVIQLRSNNGVGSVVDFLGERGSLKVITLGGR